MANSRFGFVKDVEKETLVVPLSTTFEPPVATKPSALNILAIKYVAAPSGNTVIKYDTGNFESTLYTVAPSGLAADYSLTLTDSIFIPQGGRITVDLSDQNAACYYRTSRAE